MTPLFSFPYPGLYAEYDADIDVQNYTSEPSYFFISWCLIKHRDNLAAFTLYMHVTYLSVR
jgi:hypothetical protein